MKVYFYICITLFSYYINAQNINPDQIRLNIYKIIIDDVFRNKENVSSKDIVIAPMINKFQSIKFNEYDIKLDSVKYDDNLEFCKRENFYRCSTKLDIDKYKLLNVYKNGKNEIFPFFCGIYPPIDSWYNLIYYSAVKHFQKNNHFNFNIVIPVKNVWMDKGEKSKENMSFYNFIINDDFNVVSFNKKIVEL